MRRRSKSPSRIKDASLGRHHRWKIPSGIRFKILLIISGQRPIPIPIPRSRTRRREHDPAHRLHDKTNSREEPLQRPAREATKLHSHHLQSDRDSFTKHQSTLVTQHEEYREQEDTAALSESNDESDTDSITPDVDLRGDLREELEHYLSEKSTHAAFEEETTNLSRLELGLNDRSDLGSNSDAVNTSQHEVIHPDDAENPAIYYFEDDSSPESDVELNVDSHLEPDLELDYDSDLDSDLDSEHDSDFDFNATFIAASKDEDIETPLKISISALDTSLPNLKLVHEAGTELYKDFRPGDIAFVALETCSSCPKRNQRTKWHVNQHERKYHRGQKHYLVIYNVIPGDGNQVSRAEGFSCTSLSDKSNVSSNQMEEQFLRLEGGRHGFWSSIKNGEGVSSDEKAQLLIQGPAKMRLATYVERKIPKSFPVGQLRDFPKWKPSRHRLKQESLEFLLENTTRS